MKVFQRDFVLTWEQTNDIYNHLTDDAKSELSFERFEDLIKVLEHKKHVAEMDRGALALSKLEADILRTNAAIFPQVSTPTELRQLLKSLLPDDPVVQSAYFQDETVTALWERLEQLRESPNPVLDLLKGVQTGSTSDGTGDRVSDFGRDRTMSMGISDGADDFEQLKELQIKSLNKLIAACTVIKHSDGSEAVSKLVFELMVFGENLHKGFERMGAVVAAKNQYIDFMRSEAEELKRETAGLQTKLEEFVGEVSRERSENGWISRVVELQNGGTGSFRRPFAPGNQEAGGTERTVYVADRRVRRGPLEERHGPPRAVGGQNGSQPTPDQSPGELRSVQRVGARNNVGERSPNGIGKGTAGEVANQGHAERFGTTPPPQRDSGGSGGVTGTQGRQLEVPGGHIKPAGSGVGTAVVQYQQNSRERR
jgi:hypothetical protein